MQSNLIGQIKQTFTALPDARSGNGVYQKYAMSDAALSAFSVFFMQSPSFLDYQNTMEKERGKNNAQSLFGIHLIPSANQLRNLLDPVPAETITHRFTGRYLGACSKVERSMSSMCLIRQF